MGQEDWDQTGADRKVSQAQFRQMMLGGEHPLLHTLYSLHYAYTMDLDDRYVFRWTNQGLCVGKHPGRWTGSLKLQCQVRGMGEATPTEALSGRPVEF